MPRVVSVHIRAKLTAQAGTIIGITAYTTSAHIARAVLEAVCFQTRAVLDVIEKESGARLDTLKVDGGVTNSDLTMQLQANVCVSQRSWGLG